MSEVLDYQTAANEILGWLRGVPQKIEGYTFLSLSERRRHSFNATLAVSFLNSAAAATEGSSALLEASRTSAARLRKAIAFRNAYESVANEMIMVGNGLKHTITLVMGDAGNAALRIYAIAKTLNRADDRELLIPYIADMRRAL